MFTLTTNALMFPTVFKTYRKQYRSTVSMQKSSSKISLISKFVVDAIN